jgi:DNA-binding GntR family transcriptional regulator
VRVTIDFRSSEPAYLQMARLLRERIADGTYPGGERIPSLRKLVDETGLAENTVRKAVDLLEAEGLVTGVPGRGTYVNEADGK